MLPTTHDSFLALSEALTDSGKHYRIRQVQGCHRPNYVLTHRDA